MLKKAAFIGPLDFSPSVAYLKPSQACCFVCWCQMGTFDRPPGSVSSSLHHGPR